MAQNNPGQLKMKEDWLRQELRANRTLMINQVQWGVTVLAAVELNLYYIRRDVTKHLVDLTKLKPDELLPLPRWAIGTLLLFVLAVIFTVYLNRSVRHHVEYRKQLCAMDPSYSGITEGIRVGGFIGRLHHFLFLIFPAFDLFVWAMFYVGPQLHLTIPW
jgi:hypothetical protein